MRFVAFVLLAACGNSAGGGGGGGGGGGNPDAPSAVFPDSPTNPAERWQPSAVGSTWSYKFTDPTGVKPPATGRKTTIGALEDVGGVHAGQMANKVHIETLGGWKDVWQVAMGDLDIRYKTEYYDLTATLTETDTEQPYRLKLDESGAHTQPGAKFSETFNESVVKPGVAPSSKTETLAWTVVSDSETLTVIAGTYQNVLHVRRYNAAKPETIDYWYARGVGKLKETGGNNDEELESYTP